VITKKFWVTKFNGHSHYAFEIVVVS
jgi:hypothetical protein